MLINFMSTVFVHYFILCNHLAKDAWDNEQKDIGGPLLNVVTENCPNPLLSYINGKIILSPKSSPFHPHSDNVTQIDTNLTPELAEPSYQLLLQG